MAVAAEHVSPTAVRTLAAVEGVTFSYPGAARPALADITLEIARGERIAVLGPSGSGKSTLLRALSGLVPHFHGGRFTGRVTVAGRDTRTSRPAELAGTVASVFQDPEDQVVMTRVANEVAFGLENVGAKPRTIWRKTADALERVGAAHLAERPVAELSGGELQRVCLAAALALEPDLLLLDEPTSQLDPEGAATFLEAVAALDVTVVLSEQRVERALRLAERVLFVEEGRLVLDAPTAEAREWLARERPAYVAVLGERPPGGAASCAEQILELRGVSFSYPGSGAVLSGVDLELGAGELAVLEGPNGAGKSTLARIAAGLLEPREGRVERRARAAYLTQDPGRYLVKETALEEVAFGVRSDRGSGGSRWAIPLVDRREPPDPRGHAREALARFGLGALADRHPRDLSSGERERLGLAAVAVVQPGLLVLDEPTRGIDPERKLELASWVADLAAAGVAVLVVTHDESFPAHRRLRLTREEGIREV